MKKLLPLVISTCLASSAFAATHIEFPLTLQTDANGQVIMDDLTFGQTVPEIWNIEGTNLKNTTYHLVQKRAVSVPEFDENDNVVGMHDTEIPGIIFETERHGNHWNSDVYAAYAPENSKTPLEFGIDQIIGVHFTPFNGKFNMPPSQSKLGPGFAEYDVEHLDFNDGEFNGHKCTPGSTPAKCSITFLKPGEV